MNLDDYQEQAKATAIYDKKHAIIYGSRTCRRGR